MTGKLDILAATPPIFPPPFGGVTIEHDTNERCDNAYQIAARLGFVPLCGVLPYVKVGLENSRWKIEHRHNDALTVPPESLFAVTISDSRHSALLVGAGIDLLLTSNVEFGVEWSWVRYQDITLHISPRAEDVVKFKPESNQFALRLGYKFNSCFF